MITDLFDPTDEPIITPAAFYGEQRHLCDVCLVLFSAVIHEELLRRSPCTPAAQIGACNGNIPIYTFLLDGRQAAFYLSPIGSTTASTGVIETNWLTGATRFVMFGSAGTLDREKTAGRYVVPTAAYRGEGMSYHFAAPADYIDVPGAQTVCRVFDALGAPYVTGRAFTTDAIYRETRRQIAARRSEGCIAVEMELAGVQAVCSHYGFALYNFLATGDVLDAPVYTPEGLHEANHALGKLDLALEIAKQVQALPARADNPDK